MKRAQLAADDNVRTVEQPAAPWPGRSVRLDDCLTYVRETPATAPDAEPAVYVHGLGGSGQNWTDLADLLSDRLAGQAIDLPGFGRSEPGSRYTVNALSARVIRWIEYSDRGPVHLFGNSLGGAVSVRVAALRPDLVRTLTLISPAMPFIDPRRSAHARLLPLMLVPRVDRLIVRRLSAMAPEELAREFINLCFADPGRLSAVRRDEAIEEANYRLATPWFADAYMSTFRALVSSFLRAYLPGSDSLWRLAERVEAPTLVVWGRQDRLVDVRLADRVGRTIPDSRLLLLGGVGHVAQMEVPRLVARAAVALLDEVRTVADSRGMSGPAVQPGQAMAR